MKKKTKKKCPDCKGKGGRWEEHYSNGVTKYNGIPYAQTWLQCGCKITFENGRDS